MKTRIISAIVAIAIAAVVLIFNKTIIFTIAIALIASLIVYELLKATSCITNKELSGLAISFAFLFPFINLYLNSFSGLFYIIYGLIACCMFIYEHSKIKYSRFFLSLAFPILISASLFTLVELNKAYSRLYVIIALCSAWIADTGAYFTGTLIGKHKLSPQISPKKSVEGFIGGILLDAIIVELIYIFVLNKSGNVSEYVIFFIVSLFCGAIGTLGDLTASVVKRQTGIKDYGNIMPGHGGALDRFDSVLLVAPFFYVCVSTFNL